MTRNTLVRAIDDDVATAVVSCRNHRRAHGDRRASWAALFAWCPPQATAFAYRDAEAMIVGLLMFPDTTGEPEIEAAAAWQDVAAQGTGNVPELPGLGDAVHRGRVPAGDLQPPGRGQTHVRLWKPFAANHNIGARVRTGSLGPVTTVVPPLRCAPASCLR